MVQRGVRDLTQRSGFNSGGDRAATIHTTSLSSDDGGLCQVTYFPLHNSGLHWSYPEGGKALIALVLGNLPLGNTIERVTGNIAEGRYVSQCERPMRRRK